MSIRSILKHIQSIAKWYLRRRQSIRFLIFLVFFILPISLYAYSKAPRGENMLAKITETQTSIPNPSPINSTIVIPFYYLTINRSVFYIGQFTIYGDSIYPINSTYYIYYHSKNKEGLIINLVNNSDRDIFVLSSKYNISVGNRSINYVTILLPVNHLPKRIPLWIKNITCSFVKNKHNVMFNKTYNKICS